MTSQIFLTAVSMQYVKFPLLADKKGIQIVITQSQSLDKGLLLSVISDQLATYRLTQVCCIHSQQ